MRSAAVDGILRVRSVRIRWMDMDNRFKAVFQPFGGRRVVFIITCERISYRAWSGVNPSHYIGSTLIGNSQYSGRQLCITSLPIRLLGFWPVGDQPRKDKIGSPARIYFRYQFRHTNLPVVVRESISFSMLWELPSC